MNNTKTKIYYDPLLDEIWIQLHNHWLFSENLDQDQIFPAVPVRFIKPRHFEFIGWL